jgi:pachytene checkpoint protein 2
VDVAETITQCRVMPDAAYEPLWDSIVVPPVVKDRLLRSALLALSLRPKLTFEVTALHGLAVLFGPPGTGKTTLARGLAGQLAPLTSGKQTRFIEVNPHGLMSAEHGQSQRKVAELLGEHIPRLGEDGMPTVVLLDEVESMAVARSEASLAANPADVHRATDAVLTALDANAVSMPQLFIVATSNFTRALDAAFLSRADVAIEVPAPDRDGALAILQKTLTGMGQAYPPLADLANDTGLKRVATKLAGIDGRRIRKAVTEAMLSRLETVLDPGTLTVKDLLAGATTATESSDVKEGDGHAAA